MNQVRAWSITSGWRGSPPHRYLLSQILAAVEEYRQRNGLPDLAAMRAQRGLQY